MSYPVHLLKCSSLESLFLIHIMEAGLPTPEQEYRFHPERRWRFDFAWIDQRIAAEIEGGTFKKSRHTTGTGFHNDCEKYNAATLKGWRVFRFDARMVNSLDAVRVISDVLKVFH